MKVLGNVANAYKTYKTNNVKGKKTENSSRDIKSSQFQVKDKVTISNNIKSGNVNKKEIEFLKNKLASLPEVREDKVSDIKNRIKSGTYNISPEKVADSIIDKLV
ncbi:MAG: flagellar biosynthesis anti-sigma factor FlgM [Fusobacteriia bacterium 4572_132]|nr:MAG: flagellar biosynthesis anti-sigma factor FlgM [Fusobacteriia bacterium 4572_132]